MFFLQVLALIFLALMLVILINGHLKKEIDALVITALLTFVFIVLSVGVYQQSQCSVEMVNVAAGD